MSELPIVPGDLLDVLHTLADAIHRPAGYPPEELHAQIDALIAVPPAVEVRQVEIPGRLTRAVGG